MTIRVKFFASLREQVGTSETELSAAAVATVLDAWQATTKQILPETILIAINHDYARPESKLSDGDEVAFFPPVTGG